MREENFGTYTCQANNTVGAGIPCEYEVQSGLLKNMGGANIIIIVAVIAAGIVALLLVVVVVIFIYRRSKKPTDKCKSFFFVSLSILSYHRIIVYGPICIILYA